MAIQVLMNPTENQLTLSSGIGGNDDTLSPIEAGVYHIELFESSRIGYILLLLANLADNKLKGVGTNGQIFGVIGSETVCFGHGERNEVPHRPSNEITVTFQISVLLTGCPDNAGNILGDRGFLGDNTSCHSW